MPRGSARARGTRGDIRLPIPLADLRRELPEHVLVNAITGHSKTHEGIGEQLIQRDLLVSRELTAGCAEWHMSNSFRNSASLEKHPCDAVNGRLKS